MTKKPFLLPWQKKHTIACPRCGGTIETGPLWFWEKQPDKLAKLRLQFCHSLDSEFLEKIPVLTENDWRSKQKSDAFYKEFTDDKGNNRPYEEMKFLFTVDKGLPEIFLKHGIFAIIPLFTETELKALFLVMCLEAEACPTQRFFIKALKISRSHASTIIKKLLNWRLMEAYKGSGKGRARGRQLAYKLNDEAHGILEQNLKDHDFVRDAVIQTLRQASEEFPSNLWRKDLS